MIEARELTGIEKREARRAAERAAQAEREAREERECTPEAATALATKFVTERRMQKGYVAITEVEFMELARLCRRYCVARGVLADGRKWHVDPRRWSSCRLYVES